MEEVEKRVSALFEDADRAWEEYVAAVRREVLEWEKLRPSLVERLAVLKTRISFNLEEIEELKVKLELGLIVEEKAQKKLAALSEETPKMILELERAWTIFERATLKGILHLQRLNVPPDITVEDVERKLEEVEASYKHGVIASKEVYEELKRLLNEQLRLISA